MLADRINGKCQQNTSYRVVAVDPLSLVSGLCEAVNNDCRKYTRDGDNK